MSDAEVLPLEDAPTATGPESARATRKRLRGRNTNLAGYSFLAPWLIGLAAITILPMLFSLYLSFTKYDLFGKPKWIGLDNYKTMLSDPRWLHSVQVTLTYVAASVPLRLAAALAVALLLNRITRGSGFFRSALYLPSLVGGSVAVAIAWQAMFSGQGAVNNILGFFGIASRDWINNPSTVLLTIILLSVWQFGGPMVIFLAGLKQIPEEIYEAAAIDGASPWRKFWLVTFPLLTPVIFFNLLLEVVQAFQAFTPALIIGDGQGGPADSTLFYTVYLYQKGFSDFRMGYASALAWALLIGLGIITAVLFRTARYWVFYQDQGGFGK